jgi:hypothetical protein
MVQSGSGTSVAHPFRELVGKKEQAKDISKSPEI